MNACPDRREPIALLAAGNLSGDELSVLRRHLEACPGCRQHLAEMQRVCGAVAESAAATSSAPLPNRFHQRLAARVREDAARRERPSFLTQLRAWWTAPRLAIATVAAAVLLTLILRPGPHAPPRPGPIAVVHPPQTVAPAPTLLALSRALNESSEALDTLLARQETLQAAADPPSRAMAGSP